MKTIQKDYKKKKKKNGSNINKIKFPVLNTLKTIKMALIIKIFGIRTDLFKIKSIL